MSNHTITIYELLEQKFDFCLDTYPIFDETYRETLNSSILNHFKFREIGFIMPEMFRDRLIERMTLIMDNEFNELFKTKLLEFNPLYNIDITESFERTTEGNLKSTQNTSGVDSTTSENKSNSDFTSSDEGINRVLSSQFPNQEITETELDNTGFINAQNKSSVNSKNVNKQTGLSNNKVENQNKLTNNVNNDTIGSEKWTRKEIGSSAGLSFAIAMGQFQNYIKSSNYTQQIFDRLEDLFFSKW